MEMQCSDVYRLFFEPGEVVEIRAYGLRRANAAWEGWAAGAGIVYGYFDHAEAFGKAAEGLEAAKAPGVYFTLNPANPDLLARAVNRLKAADQKTATTSDKDIVCIRWLPIDLDPKRPVGISSTREELKEAVLLRNRISEWIEQITGSTFRGVPAISGNGGHLLYRLPDLPNTDESKEMIRQALRAIDHQFHNDTIDIDQVVFNPSRIWKLYGTTARKGDHMEQRPHRKSYISKHFLTGEDALENAA